jgi:hypothetical protein
VTQLNRKKSSGLAEQALAEISFAAAAVLVWRIGINFFIDSRENPSLEGSIFFLMISLKEDDRRTASTGTSGLIPQISVV